MDQLILRHSTKTVLDKLNLTPESRAEFLKSLAKLQSAEEARLNHKTPPGSPATPLG